MTGVAVVSTTPPATRLRAVHYQGKGLLPALITLWPASQKQIVQPVGNGDYAFEIVVASLCILVRGAVPVFGPQQVFGKNPSITERQAEALSPRRITRPCGISSNCRTAFALCHLRPGSR